MSDLYEDDGCEVVVLVPGRGAGQVSVKRYAVAEKDPEKARHIVKQLMSIGEILDHVIKVPKKVMITYRLVPGNVWKALALNA